MISEQTWNNLRVEFIDELTLQFSLRQQLNDLDIAFQGANTLQKKKQVHALIDASCKRCQAMDTIIQDNANLFSHVTH